MNLMIFGGLVSVASAVGSYFWLTTPEQRELHSLGISVYQKKLGQFFESERHPLLENVNISLYYHSSYRKNHLILLEDVTREFAHFLQDNNSQLNGYDFEEMIQAQDKQGNFYFKGVPKYTLLVKGEIVIRYKDPPITGKIYSVVFSLINDIHFPVYPIVNKVPKFVFSRTIIQATLVKPSHVSIDVSRTVLEFAGPKGDFYRGEKGRIPLITFARILWDIKICNGYNHLQLLDSFGIFYSYDLRIDEYVVWPREN